MNRSYLFLDPSWRGMIALNSKRVFVFRSEILFMITSFSLRLFILQTIWTAISQDSSGELHQSSLLTYVTIVSLQNTFPTSIVCYLIWDSIRSGDVSYNLTRPFSFPKQMLASQLGFLLGHLYIISAYLPTAWIIGSLSIPSPYIICVYIVSLVSSMLIASLLWLSVGLLSFWVTSINGFRAAFNLIAEILSGALIPLWIMPDWMYRVVIFLPFQAINYIPATIFAQNDITRQTLLSLLQQMAWIAALYLITQAIWRAAQNRISIQGG